ncbi:hypothetical protein [Acinetobacter gerneri]|jgi:hypothetical protein|uniref:Uncharacterized protein n=1 Tax=Acinetobacter gerneri DSM 14967 = CIP 107464 = MTCC 9824 TaxID=1120926 RepID=N8YDY1_9GAMM|nr:hypothetical protein [Acinetobacter gerneri]ENV34836.1 hypothetical protein F960_00801 [Acinetobacter gerneri DSM 14967 = CIP 107464 = MTCC 9824]MCH4244664.1 hypothetical protein [Acinetobacter gerneri]MDV2440241.1 hypothetical protein [Acinetobacter gerneri]
MLIDFNQFQFKKFDEMVSRIKAHPQDYIDFDSVSDFYKADWLAAFPQGTTWFATGLDNGAEEFYAQIEYRHKKLTIHVKTGEIAIKSM